MEEIISPLTHSTNISLVREINVPEIIAAYQKAFDIDVAHYFAKVNQATIQLYKCNDSGYFFYYPFNLFGDHTLYEQLAHFDWYYMPWKWEHEQAAQHIDANDKVLEVGCGEGAFLQSICLDNKQAVGLELTPSALQATHSKGVQVFQESIQAHALKNPKKYDLVCSFQVLEHISQVRSFLKASINCLRKNGKLIISVPNKDSFPQYDWQNDLLNLPPHHMGLWNAQSLQSLEKIFNIKLLEIKTEPLQPYHFQWYQFIFEKKFLTNKVFSFIYYKMHIHKFFRYYITRNAQNITGHTILAIFSV